MIFLRWRLVEKPYGYEWQLTTLWQRIKAQWFKLERDNVIFIQKTAKH